MAGLRELGPRPDQRDAETDCTDLQGERRNVGVERSIRDICAEQHESCDERAGVTALDGG
jgi:hypothetical protein